MSKIYDIDVLKTDDSVKSLSDYKGKVMLIVNTATAWGFTPQYDGLQELYDKYQEQGLEILDFPCNQFGKQAPGSASEIKEFCSINFGIMFPQFKKIDVNGENASPLYKYLKSQKTGLLGSKIKWNFTKFLVDREGTVVKRFASNVEPKKIEAEIISLL